MHLSPTQPSFLLPALLLILLMFLHLILLLLLPSYVSAASSFSTSSPTISLSTNTEPISMSSLSTRVSHSPQRVGLRGVIQPTAPDNNHGYRCYGSEILATHTNSTTADFFGAHFFCRKLRLSCAPHFFERPALITNCRKDTTVDILSYSDSPQNL